jgi:Fe-S cluster biogenesis protein NfuA
MVTAVGEERAFQERIGRIEGLVQEIEATADPAFRSRVDELVQLLLELHGAGLERILGLVTEAGEPGAVLIDAIGRDPLTSSLLILHGLHPRGLEERVAAALEQARPYLNSHGGDVELLDVDGDTVRLRLEGSCHGCPSSALTLKQRIEEAIYALAPEVVTIEVVGLAEETALPPTGFVPLSELLADGVGGPA